jgi:hypothetical protein
MTDVPRGGLPWFVSGMAVAGEKDADDFLNSCFRPDLKMRTTTTAPQLHTN